MLCLSCRVKQTPGKKKKRRLRKVIEEVVRKAVRRVLVPKGEHKMSVSVSVSVGVGVGGLSKRLMVGEGAAFLTPLEFKAKRAGSDYY